MAEAIKNGTVKNPIFWICFTLCAGLVIAGFCVPPMGNIDGSVLTAVGEMFAFPTLWTVWHAIDKGIDARVKLGKTELTVGSLEEPQAQNESINEQIP
jgi:hypothetical protein